MKSILMVLVLLSAGSAFAQQNRLQRLADSTMEMLDRVELSEIRGEDRRQLRRSLRETKDILLNYVYDARFFCDQQNVKTESGRTIVRAATNEHCRNAVYRLNLGKQVACAGNLLVDRFNRQAVRFPRNRDCREVQIAEDNSRTHFCVSNKLYEFPTYLVSTYARNSDCRRALRTVRDDF